MTETDQNNVPEWEGGTFGTKNESRPEVIEVQCST